MMLERDCVGDPFAAHVGLEHTNATIVICSMQYVPHLGCMIASRALSIRFHVNKNACA
jgi:hypothetical protein